MSENKGKRNSNGWMKWIIGVQTTILLSGFAGLFLWAQDIPKREEVKDTVNIMLEGKKIEYSALYEDFLRYQDEQKEKLNQFQDSINNLTRSQTRIETMMEMFLQMNGVTPPPRPDTTESDSIDN